MYLTSAGIFAVGFSAFSFFIARVCAEGRGEVTFWCRVLETARLACASWPLAAHCTQKARKGAYISVTF